MKLANVSKLEEYSVEEISRLIRCEHPQIIALILSLFDTTTASSVLERFTERLRNDVLLRISTLDLVDTKWLRVLDESVGKKIAQIGNERLVQLGGIKVAAEILNGVKERTEISIIDNVREYDPDLAQKLLNDMFVFESVINLSDHDVQLILREVQSNCLIVALKGASEELKAKVFKNMSSTAAEMLREDLKKKGQVRSSEIEAEQREILKIIRRMADEGQIVIKEEGSK